MKEKYIVIDTETCNSLDDALVYDIGGCVIDNTGKVYETFSFVIAETYIGMKDVMQTAYYAEKLPKYETALRNGERKMIRIFTAKKIIRELCEKYNVRAIMAHNMRFDYNALNTTIRYFSKSKVRFFFPYGIELWDTMKMATDTVCKTDKYKKFCLENGYVYGKNNTVRRTAEILYRYITGNNVFNEEHQGLDDTLIEKEIFVYCTSRKKKMRRKLFDKPISRPRFSVSFQWA